MTAPRPFALSKTGLVVEQAAAYFRVGAGATGISISLSMAMIGAGHLIGISAGLAILTGIIIGSWMLLPILTASIALPGTAQHVATAIFRSEVRFFGAGVIGVAALWTFAKILGPIVAGLRSAIHASTARNDAGHVLPLAERDLPIGIIATLVICTLLYIAVVVVLTGLVRWETLVDDAAPVVNTLKKLHFSGVRLVVLIGALMGMISSLLVFQLGQARVWFAMSRDGLFPRIFARVHPRFQTPDFSTWMAGFVVGIPAGLLDIGTLADLSNIGTLFAFALVAGGVLILRYREPDRHRAFRAPGGPLAPIITILTCLLLMAGLPIMNWIRFFVWMILGLVLYYFYGRKHSTLRAANRAQEES